MLIMDTEGRMDRGGIWEISVLFIQFFCKHKTALLKKSVNKKTKRQQYVINIYVKRKKKLTSGSQLATPEHRSEHSL